MILPGATLGVLGGGQLGRMFTAAARNMGYRVIVLDPDPMSPAAALANEHLQNEYDDTNALNYLAMHCAAITTEFENVPVESLRQLESGCVVRPGSAAVARVQNRIHEKMFIRDCGLATAPFHPVSNIAELNAALEVIRLPAILKTAVFGYDGKGQRVVSDPAQARDAYAELGNIPCVLEQRIDLQMELSVLLARSHDGDVEVYPPAENIHVHGILDTTIVPARTSVATAEHARSMACVVAERLDYCGILAVEFFLAEDETLLINEIAPRPHNSGHYTLDACLTSQFEQQVRTLCGLPPGEADLLSPVVMINFLGDLWQSGAPAWGGLFRYPNAKLHIYGKDIARPGRKMGHCNVLAGKAELALDVARRIRNSLETAGSVTG